MQSYSRIIAYSLVLFLALASVPLLYAMEADRPTTATQPTRQARQQEAGVAPINALPARPDTVGGQPPLDAERPAQDAAQKPTRALERPQDATRAAGADEKRTSFCETGLERAAEKARVFSIRRDNHLSRFKHIEEVLAAAIERLTAIGVDTTELTTANAELSTLVDAFTQVSQTTLNQLNDMQSIDCSTNPDQFGYSVGVIKESTPAVKAANDAVKDHVQTVIKPALMELKQEAGA